MTMQDHMHPDDERLAAFSGADPEATGDLALSAHLDDCARCRDLVGELRVMRTALADLPDLVPSRPLRLLPPVTDVQPGFAGRAAGFIRRAFAPALTAGAALALVGLIGTTGTFTQREAGLPESDRQGAAVNVADASEAVNGFDGGGAIEGAASPSDEASQPKPADHELRGVALPSAEEGGPVAPTINDESPEAFNAGTDSDAGGSPWPIVLVAGIGFIAAVLVLRFALVPRWG